MVGRWAMPHARYAPIIKRLVAILRCARHTTLAAVDGLRTVELDHLRDDSGNAIDPAMNAHWAWFHGAEDDYRRGDTLIAFRLGSAHTAHANLTNHLTS